jgi:aldehyde dehydrogenase (NAD+)
MKHAAQFYIDGAWVEPKSTERYAVINPSTEQPIASVALANEADVDAAVAAASAAFESYSQTSIAERRALLDRIVEVASTRAEELAPLISAELGAPSALALRGHATAWTHHFRIMSDVLGSYSFEDELGTAIVVREPIGVCALISPWNWPLLQIACKVAPALAAGCTMVLKPSEIAPLNAIILAEILDDAGVPAGVFNLVNGSGSVAGAALSEHPRVDMVSFTGSTRAGIEVARRAAASVKRVTQELGGKSANIVLDDADLKTVVTRGFLDVCKNSGQSCNAPTRLLVPRHQMEEAAEIAALAAESVVVGDPQDETTVIGPLASGAQFERVQSLIQRGIAEGATLVTGGLGRPDGLERGFFVKPTVFSHVTNHMTIAREEIFGPVLVIIGYDDDDEAVRIANDTDYGLAGYVSGSPERAHAIARRLRTGTVSINGASHGFVAPFGGYRQSGNGREFGQFGLEEFLEVKSMYGVSA